MASFKVGDWVVSIQNPSAGVGLVYYVKTSGIIVVYKNSNVRHHFQPNELKLATNREHNVKALLEVLSKALPEIEDKLNKAANANEKPEEQFMYLLALSLDYMNQNKLRED